MKKQHLQGLLETTRSADTTAPSETAAAPSDAIASQSTAAATDIATPVPVVAEVAPAVPDVATPVATPMASAAHDAAAVASVAVAASVDPIAAVASDDAAVEAASANADVAADAVNALATAAPVDTVAAVTTTADVVVAAVPVDAVTAVAPASLLPSDMHALPVLPALSGLADLASSELFLGILGVPLVLIGAERFAREAAAQVAERGRTGSVAFDGFASLTAAHVCWEVIFMVLLAVAAVLGYPSELVSPEAVAQAGLETTDGKAAFLLISHVRSQLFVRMSLNLLLAPWFQANVFDGYGPFAGDASYYTSGSYTSSEAPLPDIREPAEYSSNSMQSEVRR